MNLIEDALAEYLREPTWGYEAFAQEHNALPLSRGWGWTTFLTVSGDFLFLDEETDPASIRPETDVCSQTMSLVFGIERNPGLVNLLPARSTEAENCDRCGGTGKLLIGKRSIPCVDCYGVGWPGPLDRASWLADASSAPYPRFDDAVRRFSAFAESQGLTGPLRFIAAADALFAGAVMYLHPPSQAEARERARGEYEKASRRRRGVLIASAGSLPDGTQFTYITGPADAEEAVNLMYPDGLKMSILTSPREIRVVGRLQWLLLRLLSRVSVLVEVPGSVGSNSTRRYFRSPFV